MWPTVWLKSITWLDRKQQVLILKVFHVRQDWEKLWQTCKAQVNNCDFKEGWYFWAFFKHTKPLTLGSCLKDQPSLRNPGTSQPCESFSLERLVSAEKKRRDGWLSAPVLPNSKRNGKRCCVSVPYLQGKMNETQWRTLLCLPFSQWPPHLRALSRPSPRLDLDLFGTNSWQYCSVNDCIQSFSNYASHWPQQQWQHLFWSWTVTSLLLGMWRKQVSDHL